MINIQDDLKSLLPQLIEIRQQLHSKPELQYDLPLTTDLVFKQLTAYGYKPQYFVNKSGIVAIFDSGKPGKTVALRADMDALPIHETTDLQYKSTHPNKMHACGHDGHTATLLGVAKLLQQYKQHFSGKAKLIFQPAEEGGKGSTAMIEAGALKEPNVDAIFGYHNWPGLPAGQIATRAGSVLAGNGRIELEIFGKSAHTSQPQNAINPVLIGAVLINQINTVAQSLPASEAVISQLCFNAGDPKSAQTDYGKLVLIYYIDTPATLDKIQQEIQTISNNMQEQTGSTIKIHTYPFHAPTVNTAAEANLTLEVARSLYAAEFVTEIDKCYLVADDFAEYLTNIPGCYFLVGQGKGIPLYTSFLDSCTIHVQQVNEQ